MFQYIILLFEVPMCIRGPATPFETLVMNATPDSRPLIQEVNFSRATVSDVW